MKRTTLLLVLLLGTCALAAQEYDITATDFSTRYETDFNFEVARNFTINWQEEARLKNLSTEFDRLYSTLALHYRVCDYFKFGAGYSFIFIWHDGKKKTNYEKYADLRHRIFIDLMANYRYNQWKFTLRERPVMTIRTDKTNPLKTANPNFKLRSKIEVEYAIFGQPLKPHAAFELSNTLNAPKKYGDGNYIDRIRAELGLKWYINRRNRLDFYYQFNTHYNHDIDLIKSPFDKDVVIGSNIIHERLFQHVVGIIYNFEWSR